MKVDVGAGEAAGLLEEARSLRGLIESEASAHEAASELSPAVREAIEQSNLLRMMSPRAVGGLEAEPAQMIDVLRELSHADGSVGWYCGAVMTAGGVAGAFLGERAIDAIFAGQGRARAAGQAAPLGKAEHVGDGYRISGAFSFASGSPSAEWLIGGYIVHKDGAPVMQENGVPQMILAFVPRAKVEFLGNWNVLGLRGTGSYDFRVLEQIVHQDFTFNMGGPEQLRGGFLYKMGFMAIPCLTHASFALGCGARAVDEWRVLAKTKKKPPRGALNELHTVQRDIAFAYGEMRAAESYVRATFDALYAGARKGEIPNALKMDGRLCASHATYAAVRASQVAYSSAATTGLRNGSVLQRCYRDMQAAVAHFLTGEQSILDIGAAYAEAPGAFLVF